MSNRYNFKNRSGKQCRERWHNHWDPSVNKEYWSEKEETLWFNKHMEYGNKWSDIAKFLPGRTDNAIKNHFYSKWRKYIRKILKQINKENLMKINGIDSNKYSSDKIYKMLKKYKIAYKNLSKEYIMGLVISQEKGGKACGKFENGITFLKNKTKRNKSAVKKVEIGRESSNGESVESREYDSDSDSDDMSDEDKDTRKSNKEDTTKTRSKTQRRIRNVKPGTKLTEIVSTSVNKTGIWKANPNDKKREKLVIDTSFSNKSMRLRGSKSRLIPMKLRESLSSRNRQNKHRNNNNNSNHHHHHWHEKQSNINWNSANKKWKKRKRCKRRKVSICISTPENKKLQISKIWPSRKLFNRDSTKKPDADAKKSRQLNISDFQPWKKSVEVIRTGFEIHDNTTICINKSLLPQDEFPSMSGINRNNSGEPLLEITNQTQNAYNGIPGIGDFNTSILRNQYLQGSNPTHELPKWRKDLELCLPMLEPILTPHRLNFSTDDHKLYTYFDNHPQISPVNATNLIAFPPSNRNIFNIDWNWISFENPRNANTYVVATPKQMPCMLSPNNRDWGYQNKLSYDVKTKISFSCTEPYMNNNSTLNNFAATINNQTSVNEEYLLDNINNYSNTYTGTYVNGSDVFMKNRNNKLQLDLNLVHENE